ncbi:MAG: hypothetical protein J6A48_08095 [Clostridia bacterium]|nr:hypothetical protein [Clostridia bacterium]
MKELWSKTLPPLRAVWQFLLRWRKLLVCLMGWILSLSLLVAGMCVDVPSKSISFSSYTQNGYTEYVGGDANNFIIEAGLRSGFIAGRLTQQAVYYAAAAIVLMLTLLLMFFGGVLPQKVAKEESAPEQQPMLPKDVPETPSAPVVREGSAPAPVRTRRRKAAEVVVEPVQEPVEGFVQVETSDTWETMDLTEE